MFTIITKLHNSIFSLNAIHALGISSYASYLLQFVFNIFKIARIGNLSPLDKAMGFVTKDFQYRGSSFVFDCGFCDKNLDEDSYGFGIAREIYIRDCYFKHQPEWVYRSAKTVVDLGGNRGAFSSLMTTTAERIVIVECCEQYEKIIENNFIKNKFSKYYLEKSFIGEGGMTMSDSNVISMVELFERYELETIDFMKMDIEGSEFSLFQRSDWLEKVKSISMEVHGDFGSPSEIIEILRSKGFSLRVADENLTEIHDTINACFIYAWRE